MSLQRKVTLPYVFWTLFLVWTGLQVGPRAAQSARLSEQVAYLQNGDLYVSDIIGSDTTPGKRLTRLGRFNEFAANGSKVALVGF